MHEAASLSNSIRSSGLLNDLPTIPILALEILRLSKEPDSDLAALTEVVEQDPALSSRLVSTANSAVYRRQHPAATVADAAFVLGRSAISVIALSFSLTRTLDGRHTEGGLDLDMFWRRSLTRAAVARHVAESAETGRSSEAFLGGLLSHIGTLVLARACPAPYRQVLEEAGGWPTEDRERDTLGWTSAEVTIAVLEEWKMSPTIVSGIRSALRGHAAHDPASADTCPLAHSMRLAVTVDEVIHGKGQLPASVGEQLLELDPALRRQLEGVEAGLIEVAQLSGVHLPDDLSVDDLLVQAKERLVSNSLSILTTSGQQALRLADLQRENEELTQRATTDGLTALPNRRAFDECLVRELKRRQRTRTNRSIGVVMIDIDHFKYLNDTHGHRWGDVILSTTATAMAEVVRADEVLHRYGGDEFTILVTSCDPADLTILGERLRSTVERLCPSVDGRPTSVTVSIGAACSMVVETDADMVALVERADAMLYQAKTDGRNRVFVDPNEQPIGLRG